MAVGEKEREGEKGYCNGKSKQLNCVDKVKEKGRNIKWY